MARIGLILSLHVAHLGQYVGGARASWSVHLTAARMVRVRTLARDIVLCPWARHFNSASLHPTVQMVTGEFNTGG